MLAPVTEHLAKQWAMQVVWRAPRYRRRRLVAVALLSLLGLALTASTVGAVTCRYIMNPATGQYVRICK